MLCVQVHRVLKLQLLRVGLNWIEMLRTEWYRWVACYILHTCTCDGISCNSEAFNLLMDYRYQTFGSYKAIFYLTVTSSSRDSFLGDWGASPHVAPRVCERPKVSAVHSASFGTWSLFKAAGVPSRNNSPSSSSTVIALKALGHRRGGYKDSATRLKNGSADQLKPQAEHKGWIN